MEIIDISNCLYHGVVDWLNYDKNNFREDLCLDKLKSILEHRFIYRPCDFQKYGISHNDTANPYTYYFTFLACYTDSALALRFKQDLPDDNGYIVATTYARFGILFKRELLDELNISDVSFCDEEIVFEDNIAIDKYGIGIYVNPLDISEYGFNSIKEFIERYNYPFNVVSVFDGVVVESLSKERNRIKMLSLEL